MYGTLVYNARFSYKIFCGDGGTGRHACLRGMWRKPWGFKSPSPHQFLTVAKVMGFEARERRAKRGKGLWPTVSGLATQASSASRSSQILARQPLNDLVSGPKKCGFAFWAFDPPKHLVVLLLNAKAGLAPKSF